MIQLVVLIVVVGVLLYLAQQFLAPIMDPLLFRILYALIVIVLVLYILAAFGVLPVTVPRVCP